MSIQIEEDAYNEFYKAMNSQLEIIAAEKGCSINCAGDILYLRTRSRWSQELEQALVTAHAEGKKVNIYEFGVTPETQDRLLKTATDSIEAAIKRIETLK